MPDQFVPHPGGAESIGVRPIRILLYTLIPAARELQPLKRTPFAFLRNRLRRWLDLTAWRLTGLWRAHYSTFEDRNNSNRGDIAIRMGVRRQLERLFAGKSLEIDEVAWGDLGAAISEAGAPYDLIVIAGGGYLFADPEGRLPPRFAADVDALTRTAAPIVAVSIGLNHLIMPGDSDGAEASGFNPDQYTLIRRFIDRVDLISVRDDATRRALAAVDPSCGRVIVDPAFLLASDAGRRHTGAVAPLAVGLNVAFHGTHATVINRRLLREIIHALQAFAAATPARFHYFVHSDSERAIADALRMRGLSIEVVEGDVDTMLAAYNRLDMHVGQMLHSTIFAMAVGVPALAIAYDTKSCAFFDLFGLGNICLDATALDRHSLRAAMDKLAAERHTVALTIATRGAALRRDAAGFYKSVADMVLGLVTPAPRQHALSWRSGSHPAE